MNQKNRFTCDLLDLDSPDAGADLLWRACKPTAAESIGGAAVFKLPFQAQSKSLLVEPDLTVPRKMHDLVVRAYGDSVVRLTLALGGELPGDESLMLEWHESLRPEPLAVRKTSRGWDVLDRSGAIRMQVVTADPPAKEPSQFPPPPESFNATLFPDRTTPVPLLPFDGFILPEVQDSVPLGYVERAGVPNRVAFSFHAEPGERFAGTGERFAKLDLAGRTIVLENTDAFGVNSRRAYKNVPFYLSSRPYGLFAHTTAHLRLSLADVSTRAAQGVIEHDTLDLFIIGGGSVERVLYNYRRVTGFPRNVPLWSFGTWMSRITYTSAAEVLDVADKLRAGRFPCDVLHLDTGWFEKNWQCDWEFSHERFPDPARFTAELRGRGFRLSLWQTHYLRPSNKLFAEAREKGYIVPPAAASAKSDLGGTDCLAPIDFSNPEATRWYQGKLAALLRLGAAVIKADFGEDIDPNVKYARMPGRLLHNLYALLYQKAAFEITEATTGAGIIWARSAWAGSQRYPLHWGGDPAGSWDGLAASIRGGLHLGLSGFAFWSHDVPGFYSIPNAADPPPNDLYVRWTQAGVFTSHLRYHGTYPREPYQYPAIADLVRRWWNLRYALIPYLADQAEKAVRTGLPILRALIFHHEDDPACWHIDDQFYCGDALLVAPVTSEGGVRDVYLPGGEWVDFWTGESVRGPRLLKAVESPLARIPVYARKGAAIRVYPERVQCTDEMDLANAVELTFDAAYPGLSASVLGDVTGL